MTTHDMVDVVLEDGETYLVEYDFEKGCSATEIEPEEPDVAYLCSVHKYKENFDLEPDCLATLSDADKEKCNDACIANEEEDEDWEDED